jgi:hypothetical protein
LANALPINGLNTGEISDRFLVYFVPAGYVFSIWGLIYLGLIAYAIYQALPAQRQNPRLQSSGWWVVLGGIANSCWIFLWHYEQFVATLVAMLFLLSSLLIVYIRLGPRSTSITSAGTWLAHIPFSIYLGWITVATIANVTALLDFLKWNQFGLSDEFWMVVMLAAVLIITLLMNFNRRDVAYTAVILWALAGIGVKFPQSGIVTTSVWITFGLVAVTLVAALIWRGTSVKQNG